MTRTDVLKKIFVQSEAEQKVLSVLGEFISELNDDPEASITSLFEEWIDYRPRKERYVPSRKTLHGLLNSLNESTSHELALPGRFNPTLFLSDLFKYPVLSKDRLCEQLYESMNNDQTYFDFFLQSRGYPRWRIPLDFNKRVWTLFENKPSLMMNCPGQFLDMHSVVIPSKEQLDTLNQLSKLKSNDYTKINMFALS